MSTTTEGVRYPRIIVSQKRHAQLTEEARKKKLTIEQVAEEKFKKADAK
jgi:hypothetical protein